MFSLTSSTDTGKGSTEDQDFGRRSYTADEGADLEQCLFGLIEEDREGKHQLLLVNDVKIR